jgi:hypothetical protein
MSMLMASTYRPGDRAEARAVWPSTVSLRPATDRPTIVLCLLWRCPCSDATLDALQTLLEATENKPQVYALFAVPDHADAKWTDNALVRRSNAMSGVSVVFDQGGRLCQSFDARTSGQTFVYDAAGRLAFIGGLTPGRGESGACEATAFLTDWLAGHAPSRDVFQSHVFGCALYRAPEGNP